MGIYVTALWKAINDRLGGDTTLVGLLANGSANSITNREPLSASDSGTSYPCVSFSYQGSDVGRGDESEGFDVRVHRVTFEVHLYVQRVPPSGSTDPLTLAAKIGGRIHGDWEDQSNRIPSFGLDRWQPSFSGYTGDAATSYAASICELQRVDVIPEDGLVHWVYVFESLLSKKV